MCDVRCAKRDVRGEDGSTPHERQASTVYRLALRVLLLAKLFPRIGRATGGEEAKSAINGRLGWGTRQARRLGNQIGREGRKDEHNKNRQQEALSGHDGWFREIAEEIDTSSGL